MFEIEKCIEIVEVINLKDDYVKERPNLSLTDVSLPNKIIKEKDKEVNCGNFLSINEHNFLNLIERIIF